MEFLELGDAVAGDAPAEDFLVNVREADARSELGEVGVDFDEALRVELDRLAEVGLGDLVEETAAEFGFDLLRRADELEAGGGEGDAFTQLVAVPEVGGTVGVLDEDHRLLTVVDDGRLGGEELAFAGALGAVKDVVLSDLIVTLAHQLFLDEVLDLLDADDGLSEVSDAAGDGGSDALARGGVLLERVEGHTHSEGNLVGEPRHHLAVAAHEAGRDGEGLNGGGLEAAAGEEEALGDVVAVIAHEGVLDGLQDEAFADLDAGLGEHADDVAGDGGDELAVGFGEDVLFLTGDEEVGERGADDVGDLRGIEAGGGTTGDGGQRFTPVEAGLGAGRGADGIFECDIFAEEREFGFHIEESGEGKGGRRKGRDEGRSASAVAGAWFLVKGKWLSKNRKRAKAGAAGVTPEFDQRTIKARRR